MDSLFLLLLKSSLFAGVFLKLNTSLAHFQNGPSFYQPTLEQAATGRKSVPQLYHTSKKFQRVCVTGVMLCVAGLLFRVFWNEAGGLLHL